MTTRPVIAAVGSYPASVDDARDVSAAMANEATRAIEAIKASESAAAAAAFEPSAAQIAESMEDVNRRAKEMERAALATMPKGSVLPDEVRLGFTEKALADRQRERIAKLEAEIPPSLRETLRSLQDKALVLPDGNRYEGSVNREGRPHGKGVLYYLDSDERKRDRYEGEFFNGLKQGQGRILFKDGSWGQGRFMNDQLEGQGEIYKQGWTHRGEFHGGMLNGYGTSMNLQEFSYTGAFLNGKYHGKGRKEYFKQEYHGIFIKDSKEYTVYYKVYEGAFAESAYHGQGKMTLSDGSYFEGTFNKGVFEGRGVLIFGLSPSREVGIFKNWRLWDGNKYHGYGQHDQTVVRVKEGKEVSCVVM